MLSYKVVNLYGGNITDRFISEPVINAMASEGWKLISIAVPPNSQNMKHVLGTFVRDEAVVAKNAPTVAKIATVDPVVEKKPVGRPPKVAAEAK